MSKIKWGAIVVDGRGKLGGHVFTKTKSGATMRTKVTPVNPQTVAQASARSRLGGNSQAWANLTEEQRESWQVRAAETSKTNVFGDQYFPSGKNLFTSINNNLLLIGQQVVKVAPIIEQMPFIVELSFTAVASTGLISLVFDYSGSGISSHIVYEATSGFSRGRYNFDGSYRVIGDAPIGSYLNGSQLGAAYVAKFGALVPGTKVSFRCYFVNRNTGQVSPRFTATAIVE